MYEVIVKDGRKIVARKTFKNEDDAWYFVEQNENRFEVEFKNLEHLKSARR